MSKIQVSVVAAMTADGLIDAEGNSRSFDWTTRADKKYYIDAIKRAGVTIVGSKTFGPIKRFPRGMKYFVYTRNPKKLVNPKPHLIEVYPTQDSPRDLLKQIEAEGYSEVIISGGSSIYTMFLQAGVVDKIYLSIEPLMFGKGVRLVDGGFEDVKLKLEDVKKLGDEGTVVLEYSVTINPNSEINRF